MHTRVRKLHVKTCGGGASIELDISRQTKAHKLEGAADRANLNAWLSQSVRTSVRSVGAGQSSTSSQSTCGVGGMAGRASAQGTAGGIRQTRLEMHDED